MEASGIWTVLRRRVRLVVLAVLIASATALAVSMVLPRTYESRTTLIVGQSLTALNPDINTLLASQRLSQTYVQVATTRGVLGNVIASLGLDETTDDLAKRVSAATEQDTSLLTVTVQDADPQRAANVANAVADQLIAVTPTVQGQRSEVLTSVARDLDATRDQIDVAQAEIDRLSTIEKPTSDEEARIQLLQGRLSTLRSTYVSLLSLSSNLVTNLLSVVEPAVPADDPAFPKVPVNLALGALLGLLLGITVAFVVETLDDTLKSSEDVAAQLDLPTLGSIIRMPGEAGRREIYSVVTLTFPRSRDAERFRTLRTNVEFAGIDNPLRTLLVTSAVPGEGKTIVAANLAVAFAQGGRRTLLVDADLRRPGLHTLFRLGDELGLTTLLKADPISLEMPSQATEEANLRVISSGPLPANPAELLGSNRMRSTISALRENAELVIFDSPPLETVTDAAVLASMVDATLLVVEAGKSRRGSVTHAREALGRVGAQVLGVVLNRVPRPDSEASGYGYYDTQRDREASQRDEPIAAAPSAAE